MSNDGAHRCRSRGGNSLCGASRRHRTHTTGSSCGASRRSSNRGKGNCSCYFRSGNGGGHPNKRGFNWSKQGGARGATRTRTNWNGYYSLTNGSWRYNFFYHSFCASDTGSRFSGSYSRSFSWCSHRYEGSYSSSCTLLLCIGRWCRAGGAAKRNQTGTVSSLSSAPTTGTRTTCSRTWSTRKPSVSYRSNHRSRRRNSSGNRTTSVGRATNRNKSGRTSGTSVATTGTRYCGSTYRSRPISSRTSCRSGDTHSLLRPSCATAVKRSKFALHRRSNPGASRGNFWRNSTAKHKKGPTIHFNVEQGDFPDIESANLA